MTEQEHGSVAMGDSTLTEEMVEAARQELRNWDYIVSPIVVEYALVAALARPAHATEDGQCPRPCNDRPANFSMRSCIEAGECGCIAFPSRPAQEPVADDIVERIAIDMHYADGDPCTVKWAKQPGKYRASLRRDVRDVLAALDRLGIHRPQPAHGTSETERAAENEPVAWRYSDSGRSQGYDTRFSEYPPSQSPYIHDITPLYEHPSPAPNAVTAGQGVEVKPLTWQDQSDTGKTFLVSKNQIGMSYTIDVENLITFVYSGSREVARLPWDGMDAAKAAAQADYEQRILSALATPTPKEESK